MRYFNRILALPTVLWVVFLVSACGSASSQKSGLSLDQAFVSYNIVVDQINRSVTANTKIMDKDGKRAGLSSGHTISLNDTEFKRLETKDGKVSYVLPTVPESKLYNLVITDPEGKQTTYEFNFKETVFPGFRRTLNSGMNLDVFGTWRGYQPDMEFRVFFTNDAGKEISFSKEEIVANNGVDMSKLREFGNCRIAVCHEYSGKTDLGTEPFPGGGEVNFTVRGKVGGHQFTVIN